MRLTEVLRLILAIPVIAFAALPAEGQWLHYPTPGLPRTPAGEFHPEAPAARTPDGHPDLSGLWRPDDTQTCPIERCPFGGGKLPLAFANIAFGLEQGLPYRPWAATLVAERAARRYFDNPASRCLPLGAVRMLAHPLLRRIVQSSERLVMLYEHDASYRQIFLDGRSWPMDMQPAWNGYSVGRWEGETLVVATTGFPDGLWLDAAGNPLTDAARITERYRRPAFGRLDVEVTVDDPKAYTVPWTVHLNQQFVPDTELIDAICLENEKSRQHMTPQ
jgi:hypothetical protein